ncbi:TatD family hydrolase [Sporosarcina limicola]|uniref:TatD DNase family protein n=1 Tax=Sporosarcina limicola TaxID=34101 RepID=A0A927MJK1_9BACL|nr:TatD family hydrolase [Sporosarcina limicola]MBE1555904.1 TatD DNase family protein [Sporosarcina limicola]
MTFADERKQYIIDAHIHLVQYATENQRTIIDYLEHPSSELHGLITVSMDVASGIRNLKLAEKHPRIHPTFGFHPEQEIPSTIELDKLFGFMEVNKEKMVAVGEVGLPYYLREKSPNLQLEPYCKLLEEFIRLAKLWVKPIVLHAVYEDASIACDLLEKHSIEKAHFHWFKGPTSTVERMIQNGYYISVTPDCVYEQEIQTLIDLYPIEQLMVETDGPWPFEGPFTNEMTHPTMMHHSIATIARIKNVGIEDVYIQLYNNVKQFYSI